MGDSNVRYSLSNILRRPGDMGVIFLKEFHFKFLLNKIPQIPREAAFRAESFRIEGSVLSPRLRLMPTHDTF